MIVELALVLDEGFLVLPARHRLVVELDRDAVERYRADR